MATRRENVVLSLEDNFTAGMARAAAATKILERELDGLSGHAVRSQRGLDDTAKSTESLARSTERSGAQIDRLSGRLALLTQAASVLGPALVPIGAAAVPAVAGLSLQLGLAAGAAGVAVLAFQGIGDGLKALNAYQINPTAANFAKLNQAMDKLGPAGQEFVLALDKMTPKFRALQAVAEQGVLPGVTDGLNEVITLMPQFRAVVATVSTTLGDLARDAGAGLTGPQFREFFDYINRTARPVLTEMGQTVGNFVAGIANLIQAVDPLSRSFSSGFLDMSEAFAKWTDGLSGTEGFQEFVDYISSNGGKALDALGSLANAMLQIVEAAAPVGSAVLPVITELADGLAAIADSPAGPALLGAAAAFSVLSRSMAAVKALTTGGSFIGKTLGTDGIKASLPTVSQFGTVFAKAGQSAKYASEETLKARTSVRQFASALGPSAALVSGLALASSGLAEKTGLANTASYALMGTIAGPWGAAIGGGIGFVTDLASANDALVTSTKSLDRAFAGNATSLDTMSSALKQAQAAQNDYMNPTLLQQTTRGWTEFFTHAGREGAAEIAKTSEELMNLKVGLLDVGTATGNLKWQDIGNGAKAASAGPQQLQQILDLTATAFEHAGRSAADAKTFLEQGASGDGFREGVGIIRDYVATVDSVPGRAKAVADAMAALGNQMESNVTQADALKQAMDSLFGVQLNQSAATDAWTQGLKALHDEIAKTNGALAGNSDAALKNRDAIRGSVAQLEDKVAADAAAGASGRKLVDSLIAGRNAIIDQAAAAGANRGKVEAYLKTLGLTPKSITTFITENGSLNARQKVDALIKLYKLTPKQVRTLVSESGAEPSRAKVEQLARALNLTPKQIRTILTALDNASPTIGRVKLGIASVQGKTVTITTIHRDIRVGGGSGIAANPTLNADGGTVPKTGLPYADRHPYLLADGEEVISNRYGQADRHRDLLKAINAGRLADGGTAGRNLPRDPQTRADVLRLLIEIRDLRRDLAATGKDALTGLERQRKLAELADAKRDLAERRGEPAREAAAKAKAAREKRQQARESFDLTGDMDVKQVREAFKQFRDDLHLGGKALRGLEQRAVRTSRAFDRHTKTLEDAKAERDRLRSDKLSYSSQVAGAFTHDPFGNGLAGLQLQLEADRNDALEATALKNTLEKNGISKEFEKALLASGDLNTIRQAAQLSRGDLAGYNSLYASSTSATTALGNQVAAQVYNAAIEKQNTLISNQTATLKILNQRMENLEDRVERGARAGVRDRDRDANSRKKAGR